jgi:hypothetical protein
MLLVLHRPPLEKVKLFRPETSRVGLPLGVERGRVGLVRARLTG